MKKMRMLDIKEIIKDDYKEVIKELKEDVGVIDFDF